MYLEHWMGIESYYTHLLTLVEACWMNSKFRPPTILNIFFVNCIQCLGEICNISNSEYLNLRHLLIKIGFNLVLMVSFI